MDVTKMSNTTSYYDNTLLKVLNSSSEVKNVSGNGLGKRHIQIVLLGMILFLSHSLKVSMSVCVVAMTDSTASVNKNIPTYHWTNKGLVLSAFFWGMIIPAVAAGWLATRYGAKRFLLCAMMINSVVGCLIPTLAAFGSIWVIICRGIQGFCNGFVLPSLYALFGKWIPAYERSRCMGFIYSGGIIGVITSNLLSGYVANTEFGWPAIFYMYSIFGIMWCLLFWIFGENSPASHKTISQEEKKYIQLSLSTQEKKKLATPWKKIFTSTCFLSLIIAECGDHFAYYLLVSQIPNYLKHIVKLGISNNGLISSLPHIVSWILIYILSYISDKLISSQTLSITATRKSVAAVGIIVPAISLTALAFCGPEDNIKAIIFLVVGLSVETAVAYSGIYVNSVDLSPNHAGILGGICNQFSKLCSALGPVVVHFVLTSDVNLNQWKTLFFITTAVKFCTGTVFVLFGSAEIQPWNYEIDISTKSAKPAKDYVAVETTEVNSTGL
ncbi:putative inorganic phosphate cotransporter isoform X2 [Diabrotica virgifera virgifera]|uniref:Major facilitator superfamily (MFS) profile domain-containing protein n=2 Tax=Diabrotica virgifera virgifera TaxID=50390 RepID=A0ABM5KNH9_DIAVI|nr:putative inorganic phosphate cotransporter isoform X2 [Diabrotica virgifera virgifera]